ncbi:MAG: DUF2905 domain-containing protein [candidate division WOR-3 bacterium]|nr:DUF2905 domain-containing protein [candidate division WOR-3 bacterium]
MSDFSSLGKILIILGFFLIVLGLGIILISKLHIFPLPGDIFIQRKNFTFYFPIISSLILSLILTIILNLILRR